MNVIIKKSKLKGEVIAPPSKSYSHRYLIGAMLANNQSIISNIYFSDDVLATLNCIKAMGKNYKIDGNNIEIYDDNIDNDLPIFDCNESGSTLRFLIPIALSKYEKVIFKGSKKPNKSWLSKLGKFISKHTNEKYSSEFEYNGHNFTNTLMACLSLFGLLAPRGYRAYSRAQVDENGKKDLTELYEILIRDIASSLSVVFAVPMLTRAAVTAYENKSGFVLMHKDRTKSKLATMFDLINPYSSAHVLTNSEIQSLYNTIDSKEKMLNFCKYVEKKKNIDKLILSGVAIRDAIKGDFASQIKHFEKTKGIVCSLESGSDRILKLMKKGFTVYEFLKFFETINSINKKALFLIITMPFTPSCFVNFAMGVSDFDAKTYIKIMAGAKIVMLTLLSLFGQSVVQAFENPVFIVLAVVLVAVLYLVSRYIKKRHNLD